ncbi:LacI family DNA-binding transcriptional regulator [Blautia sp. MSJ-36]|uniref:LacI family DNA-binding transcriptional regulator n=1 Tax=Blautia sp. MSJ-36 TaxID=2841530 RepID=UPI001C11DCC8|nr:LacI family transcriptional regulator [Blautia sp. MSJ-36]
MNIYDIAKLADVSIATVSRVVNNSPKVSARTKEKVLAIMKENEYTPNAFARGLGLGTMKTVGIICPDISDIYMAKAVSYLESNLHDHGYDCILGCSGFKQKEKESYVKLLLSKKIDTLILVGSTYAGSGKDEADTDYIREAAEQASVFMINAKVAGDNIYCTYADDFQATYEVTKAYLRRGKEKILFMYDSESFSARQKLAGYEAALQDAGYPVLGNLKFKTKNDIEYTKNMLLEYNKVLDFDSVLATDDGIAAGAVKYAKIKGLSIPEELSITGYNNSILALCSDPELTSVDSKLGVMCRKTVERMIELLENEAQIEKNVCVPCEIVRRCTTDY